MSGFSFRPAVRENVGLLIGLAGSSGSGKTFTAMRLASGIAQGKRFAVIDTEAGRAKHYADQFQFDHGDLSPPFRPDAYAAAIAAADKAGYPVIVVDSMSHEWAGDGGILDWQEEEFQRLGGRDAVKMTAWIKPKQAHKHMVSRLLQVRAHLILCMRAEEKIDIVDDPDKPGKKKIVPKVGPAGFKGWLPICEKNLPYELTASFLLTADAPGVPKPIKLQEQHRALFPLDKPITEESGRLIAQWATGGTKRAPAETKPPARETSAFEDDAFADEPPPARIDENQALDLATLCTDNGIKIEALCKAAHVEKLDDIAVNDLPRAKQWIDRAIEKRQHAQ